MRKLLWIILLLSASHIAISQQPDSVITLKKLTDSINTLISEQKIPGLMLGITKKDTILFSGGFGYADVAAKRPVTNQTLFRMGSITKMFVSLAILQLVYEGKLHLTDELKKIAPEVPFVNQWEAEHPVRIVNLLEHTAGFDDMKLNRMFSLNPKEYRGLEMVLLQKNSFVCRWRPGERTSYSNPGYAILGYIIQKITGKYYDDYLLENILRPIGMLRSNFNLLGKLPQQEVKEYVVEKGKIKAVPSVTSLIGPAGSLWSCSDDMIRFLQLFLHNGQPIFTESIIDEMETPISSLAAERGLKTTYALANTTAHFYNKNSYKGHNGLTGTCYSSFIYNRKTGFGFVLSSNGNNPNFEVENLVTDYIEQGAPVSELSTVTLNLKNITPFLGVYQFESPRNEIVSFKDKLLMTPSIYLENNALYLKYIFDEKIKLLQTSPGIFAKEGANMPGIIFTKSDEGKIVAVIDGGYYEKTSYLQVAFKQWITALAILFAIAGVCTGTISLVAALTGKLQWKKLPLRILPMLAIESLTWAILNLSKIQEQAWLLSELSYVNSRSLIIFTGTLLFAIFSLLHLLLVAKKLRQFKNKWFAGYWLLTDFSLCYILIVLFQNGWIGLRTWAM